MKDSGFIFFILIPLIPFIFALLRAATTENVQNEFQRLGTLKGKSKREIILSVGPPNSVSALSHGKSLLQWQRNGYHIALIFDGEICEGVTHEHSSPGYMA